MVITNGKNRDLASSAQVKADPRQVAGVCFHVLLDPLIQSADGIARDFFSRPHLYIDLGDPTVVEDLARLAARHGTGEGVPSREQRVVICVSLFGVLGAPASGQSSFERSPDEYAGVRDREFAIGRAPADPRTAPALADLTQAEQAVARLAATGRTNRQIAAALYVSIKTVEFHLRHIFDKLGIRSRKDLVTCISSTRFAGEPLRSRQLAYVLTC
jgi:DNA-binding CsgD family transcriptional regulator